MAPTNMARTTVPIRSRPGHFGIGRPRHATTSLTLVMARLTRRDLLLVIGAGALVGSACVQPPERPSQTPPSSLPPEFDAWNREAIGMLSDALNALRTFDVFMAFRVTTAASNARTPHDLDWDPPTSADWNEATHVVQGLHARADQLFQAVHSARIDPSLWREQRALDENVHTLLDLGVVLAGYRERLDTLPPGDASTVADLLDRAWAQWTDCAARWDLSRSEPIGPPG
jgi:hypothetical protein